MPLSAPLLTGRQCFQDLADALAIYGEDPRAVIRVGAGRLPDYEAEGIETSDMCLE